MRALATLVLGLLLSGCATKGVVPVPELAKAPAPTAEELRICLPEDARPRPERRGVLPGTAVFVFADVYEFAHRRGAMVTRNSGLHRPPTGVPPGANRVTAAFGDALRRGLERTEAFERVTFAETPCALDPDPNAEVPTLWIRLDHAYGMQLRVYKRWSYPIARFGDQVWIDTEEEGSATPAVGYARAAVELCHAGTCTPFTVVGQAEKGPFDVRRRPGHLLRSDINIVWGNALGDLAGRIARTVLSER